MIVVRIFLNVKAENRPSFLQLMREDTAMTLGYPGCLRFDVAQNVAQDDGYVLYEEWESLETFNQYRQSDYFKALGGKVFPLVDGTPDSVYYEAAAFA